MPVRRPVVAVVLLALLGASATAEVITVTPAQLDLDGAWSGPAVPEEPPPGEAWVVRRNGEAVLTVTRAQAGNTAAWRSKTREAYIDGVEAAILRGAEKLSSKRSKIGRDNVPVLDIVMRRKSPSGRMEMVAVRVLLFRTVTVGAAAGAPDSRSGKKLVEGAVTKLVPLRM